MTVVGADSGSLQNTILCLLLDFNIVNSQHKQQWLWTTGFECHIPFTTIDNTSSKMTVVLGLQQLVYDAKSNRRPY